MRIFIGNLSYKATTQEVLDVFNESEFELTDLHIMTDRQTGQPRGFAFAECDDHRVCEHMNNTDILGRRIIVNEARPKEERPKREWKGEPRENWHG